MSGHTDSESQSKDYRQEDEVEIFFQIAAVMAAALLLPWVYAILERANFHDFKFDGLHRSRALWLVPLFYLVGAVGTVLLFPAHLQLFWAFHVLLIAQIAEVLLHQAGYLTGLSLPLLEQFTPLRMGGFVVALGSAVYAGQRLRSWDTERELRRIIDDGNYVLPFQGLSAASERMSLSRFVPLQKDRSILVLGETGAGKTETIKLLTHQMQAGTDDPFVVFDYKGEYQESFEHDHEHEDLIYLSSTGATEYWNLFAEIEREADIDEIGRALFPQTDGAEFFSQAGRQLFVAVVTYLHREAQASDTTPTNADLVAFVQSTDKQEMHERLTDHSDLTAQRRQSTRIRNDRRPASTRTSSKSSLTSSAATSPRRVSSRSASIWTIHRDGRCCWISRLQRVTQSNLRFGSSSTGRHGLHSRTSRTRTSSSTSSRDFPASGRSVI